MSNFVHLHTHTEFSTLDGINRVETLPSRVAEMGMPAVAQTDHGNMAGSYKFFNSCKQAGVKPILGIEAYYTVGDRTAKERDDLNQPYYHLILLAKNRNGLENLFKMSSKAYTSGMYFKPRMDDELLSTHSADVIATSACLGSRSSQLILKDQKNAAERLIDHHAQMFKDNFFIELQLHEDDEQQKVNKVLMEIARKKGLPLLLTNDSHYTMQEDKLLHEQALCMQTNDVMSNPKRFSFGPIDVHLASHDWMWEKAQQQGIPYEAISNSVGIADVIESNTYFNNIKNRYPTFRKLPEGVTSWEALARLSKHMLTERMGGLPPQAYRDRLNYELKAIKKIGFSDYMLLVWEFLDGIRKESIIVGPGRGSAAGSLVAYALRITEIDPIKYNLLFDRFLNLGRAAKPLILTEEMKQDATNHRRDTRSCSHRHDHDCTSESCASTSCKCSKPSVFDKYRHKL